MPTNTYPPTAASFEDANTRPDDMRDSIERWIHDLVEATDKALASEQFQAWLDVQSRFHGYSYRNTLLIARQCPGATRVAGYRTWQQKFNRHVKEGETAIWIWAPIIAKRCPECQHSSTYHEQRDCDYDEIPPEDWSKGLVGFRPVPVFDVSQTDGEPLPALETDASGDVGTLVGALARAAELLEVSLELVPEDEWTRGRSKGVCRWSETESGPPEIAVNAGLDDADLAVTIAHEYAHALLHVTDVDERPKREIEAEAVAYVVGRYFGLDVAGSAFYLAAWSEEAPSDIEERLGRISETAETIIESVG